MKNQNILQSKNVQKGIVGAGIVASLGLAAVGITSPKAEVPRASSAPTHNQEESALISAIGNVDEGFDAPVASEQVDLPGAVGTATGQPLVLNVDGKQYFAYTQGNEPDFNKSPKELADSMAIVPNTGPEVATTPASVNKAGTLETGLGSAHEVPVGFAAGGDNPQK